MSLTFCINLKPYSVFNLVVHKSKLECYPKERITICGLHVMKNKHCNEGGQVSCPTDKRLISFFHFRKTPCIDRDKFWVQVINSLRNTKYYLRKCETARLVVAPCQRNSLASEDSGGIIWLRNYLLSITCWIKILHVTLRAVNKTLSCQFV